MPAAGRAGHPRPVAAPRRPGGGPDLLHADLAAAVGPSHVLADPALRAQYEVDWTRRWGGPARLVVRPGTTAEVAAVVRTCARHGTPIVVQGGNTGLVGGGVPPAGGEAGATAVVLSLRRLDAVGEVDVAAAQLAVGAGVTLDRVQAVAAGAGLAFGVDLAARATATVGGMVATNAGGIHVLRYGSMRSQVVGVEVVLADGTTVARMGGLVKDNCGYDLPGLMCGSEGTLGVVTAVRLRLVPRLPERVVALCACDDLGDVAAFAAGLARRLPSLHAVEAVDRSGLQLVLEHAGLPDPFPERPPWTVLVEASGHGDVVEEVAEALGRLADPERVVVGTEPRQLATLWSYRERLTEAISAAGVPHKFDVSLPAAQLAPFDRALRAALRRACPAARLVVFGHIGDGNLHVNVIGADPVDDGLDACILQLVAAHHGSISAEHGIGRAKARWLGLGRSAADIRAMASIKAALDPDGLLNPGVLFGP